MSRRLVRLIVTLLAALLAAPAALIAAATSPAAALTATVSAAVQPGHAPVECVNDVERQFNGLKHHPEALGFHLGAGAYDPTSGRHYQGIARLPGEGTPRFLTTRNGNVGDFELPGNDDQPGELNVVELASRDTNGERVRSNRLVANTLTEFTEPPAEDRVIQSLKFGGEGPFEGMKYRHIGGLQMWGDIAILGMDRAFGPGNNITGQIVLIDTNHLDDPRSAGTFALPHQASSIGVAPFGDNRLLLITTGNDGSPIYGYEFMKGGQPTRDLSYDVAKPTYLHKLWEFDAASKPYVAWPTGFQSLQNTNLFTDCATGEMYLMGGYNLNPFENTSRDRLGMWKINPLTGVMSSPVSKRQVWCEWDYIDRLCNMGAASGFYVSPSGDLIMYATTHDNDAPNSTVSMAEFTSQDGYDQDGAYRPTAVPGTYKGVANAPITLNGTASRPAIAQGRVELYDDPNFGGRGLVLDVPDVGKEDYRHLGRVDEYNDEASSVRWRVPVGCQAVLFDGKDYTGPNRILDAGHGEARTIANLRSFNDDTTSVRFEGDCTGRVQTWSWDLDVDGTVDGTGPTPTVTPKTGGVHRLALTVCSGFGVCDTKEGTLDASAGELPTTTATLNGTAGANGWYRSAVNVSLAATGDPAPTEIRWSATGADPSAERVVTGNSATVVIDAQGQTVLHYRAVNSSGQEADKTVTVKVDSVAPVVGVRSPVEGGRIATGSAVTVVADCTDPTSGVASCSPNGTALDTSGTGPRTLTVTATDAAGNSTPKDVHYTLVAAPTVNDKLVFVARSDASPGPIQVSNADGSNVVQLDDRGDDPVWSPDGSKVAYTKGVGSVRQVMVAAADASSVPVAITASTTWQASSPAWSPDGSRIVYTGTWVEAPSDTVRIIHQGLFTVPAAGGASTTVVTSDNTDLLDPVYTRNGTSITYVAGNDVYSAPVAGLPAGQLGTQLVGGLPWYQHIVHPQWSADGKTLLFQVAESETFTADVFAWNGTGDPVNLTGASVAWPLEEGTTAPYEGGPTWLADGRIIFVQDGNVYVMAAQRGAERTPLADLAYSVRNVDARGA